MSKRFDFFNGLMGRCRGKGVTELWVLMVLFEQARGVGMHVAEIKDVTGMSYHRLAQCLKVLKCNGEVVRVGLEQRGPRARGKYLIGLTRDGHDRCVRDFYGKEL